MIQSSQPRKERKFRYNAPMHIRQKFVHVQISDDLTKKLGIKLRNISVRKGDTVKIMAGKNRGKTGKVSDVSLRTGRVLVDGINKRNAKGKEMLVSIYSSNLSITDLILTDKLRSQKIDAAKTGAPKQAAAPATPKAEPAKKV